METAHVDAVREAFIKEGEFEICFPFLTIPWLILIVGYGNCSRWCSYDSRRGIRQRRGVWLWCSEYDTESTEPDTCDDTAPPDATT